MYKKWQKLGTFVKKGYIFYTFCKCVQYLPPFVFLKYKRVIYYIKKGRGSEHPHSVCKDASFIRLLRQAPSNTRKISPGLTNNNFQ